MLSSILPRRSDSNRSTRCGDLCSFILHWCSSMATAQLALTKGVHLQHSTPQWPGAPPLYSTPTSAPPTPLAAIFEAGAAAGLHALHARGPRHHIFLLQTWQASRCCFGWLEAGWRAATGWVPLRGSVRGSRQSRKAAREWSRAAVRMPWCTEGAAGAARTDAMCNVSCSAFGMLDGSFNAACTLHESAWLACLELAWASVYMHLVSRVQGVNNVFTPGCCTLDWACGRY